MHNEEPVSFRKFAAMVGQSEGAVRKAIARESIKAGLVLIDGAKKIIPEVAAAEWGKVILNTLADPAAEVVDAVDTAAIVPVAADIVIPDPAPGNLPEHIADIPADDPDDAAEDAELRQLIPNGITKAEADRRLSVLKARKAQIELDELEGRLVDKQVVYQNLAEMGIAIRDTFMNLPSRHLDEIIAADSRNERLILFENAIANSLKSLVALDNVRFERK